MKREEKYDVWNAKKKEIELFGPLRTFREGEVWWAGCGQNIGTEIFGKGDDFARPVVVLKKFSKYGFLGIPLTSQKHLDSPDWYIEFGFDKKKEYAAIVQAKVMSAKRLYRKIGMLPDSDLEKIRDGLMKLISK